MDHYRHIGRGSSTQKADLTLLIIKTKLLNGMILGRKVEMFMHRRRLNISTLNSDNSVITTQNHLIARLQLVEAQSLRTPIIK